MFNKITANNDSTYAETREQAEALEMKIASGSGIDVAAYQPITIVWDVAKVALNAKDFHDANSKIADYSSSHSSSTTVGVGASYGPFSASVQHGFANTSNKRDFFSDENALNTFRQENCNESGKEPRITARGLNLVSVGQLESIVKSDATVVAYKPTNLVKTKDIPATLRLVEALGDSEAVNQWGNAVRPVGCVWASGCDWGRRGDVGA